MIVSDSLYDFTRPCRMSVCGVMMPARCDLLETTLSAPIYVGAIAGVGTEEMSSPVQLFMLAYMEVEECVEEHVRDAAFF